MPGQAADFDAVFKRLRSILEPYGRQMHVIDDGADGYSIDMAPAGERNPTTWFAGVRRGKAYVSYYLMPVYVEPALLDGVSSELRKRMQGKSCFNFRSVDEALMAELADLTRRGYEASAGRASWGAEHREERGMAYRKSMSVDRATHEARRDSSGGRPLARQKGSSPGDSSSRADEAGRAGGPNRADGAGRG